MTDIKTVKRSVLKRLSTPGAAIRSYVPAVVAARGIAFVRTLLVAQLFGIAGKAEYGTYQPALELVNWIVPLVMFGLSDVIERYASNLEATGHLRVTIQRHLARLVALGVTATLLLLASSALLTRHYFHAQHDNTPVSEFESWTPQLLFMAEAGLTILLLALYQYAAALLRGLRAYGFTAAMEVASALLFLAFAVAATHWRTASSLLLAYAASTLCVLLPAAWAISTHLHPARSLPAGNKPTNHGTFATWALLRLLLMMTFGLVSIWSVGHLAVALSAPSPQQLTADFSMPYRIAQLLAYIAITLWSSVYGIASAAYSRGERRHARRQFLRIGLLGTALTAFGAICLAFGAPVIARVLPAYAAAIHTYLPAMALLFFWYGLLAFASNWCDLHEAPHRGAAIWAIAVILQTTLILFPIATRAPASQAILAALTGLGISLFIAAPLILRPFKINPATLVLAALGASMITLLLPTFTGPAIALILLAAISLLAFKQRLFSSH